MAETTESGSNSWLAFIVGALLVGLVVLGYMMFTQRSESTVRHELDFKIEAPKLPTPSLPTPAPAAPTQNQ